MIKFSLLPNTFGLVIPRYRSLSQWAKVYNEVVQGRQVSEKTKANKKSILAHIIEPLGNLVISKIKPHQIAALVNGLHKLHPQTSKKVLFEARDLFNEAINYGWIDRNPALSVKPPVVRVQRTRLSFEHWIKIHKYAFENMPCWVSRMLVLALVTGQRRGDLANLQFKDIWDNHLHIEQAKTGSRLALPLSLRLTVLELTLGDAITDCEKYYKSSQFLLRKHNGCKLGDASLSAKFEEARENSLPPFEVGFPPSLHECRSLSERLYRSQGINTRVLLGHKSQKMTDLYNNDRGLTGNDWETLVI